MPTSMYLSPRGETRVKELCEKLQTTPGKLFQALANETSDEDAATKLRAWTTLESEEKKVRREKRQDLASKIMKLSPEQIEAIDKMASA